MGKTDNKYRRCGRQCIPVNKLKLRFRFFCQVDCFIIRLYENRKYTCYQYDDKDKKKQHLIIYIFKQCECNVRSDGRRHDKAQTEIPDPFSSTPCRQSEGRYRADRCCRHTIGKPVKKPDNE